MKKEQNKWIQENPWLLLPLYMLGNLLGTIKSFEKVICDMKGGGGGGQSVG